MKKVKLSTIDSTGEERTLDVDNIYQKDAKWLIDNEIKLILEEIPDIDGHRAGQMNLQYATVDGNSHTHSTVWVQNDGSPRDYFRELVKEVKKERTTKNRKIEREKK